MNRMSKHFIQHKDVGDSLSQAFIIKSINLSNLSERKKVLNHESDIKFKRKVQQTKCRKTLTGP